MIRVVDMNMSPRKSGWELVMIRDYPSGPFPASYSLLLDGEQVGFVYKDPDRGGWVPELALSDTVSIEAEALWGVCRIYEQGFKEPDIAAAAILLLVEGARNKSREPDPC